MEVDNASPFKASLDPYLAKDGCEGRIAILKATFEFVDGRDAAVAEEQEPIWIGDRYRGDPSTTSLVEASDGAWAKVGADVIVCGHAYAPNGRLASSFACGIRIGHLVKRVVVFGDRRWLCSNRGLARIDGPEPCVRVPLLWELSYGGQDPSTIKAPSPAFEPRNPVGTGFVLNGSPTSLHGMRLPNFEYPHAIIRHWRDRPAPAGFGFVGRNWKPRIDFAGTYDTVWLRERAPIPPADMQERFFNAAPLDQMLSHPLDGGEEVTLGNLCKKSLVLFRLPRLYVRFSVLRFGELTVLKPTLDTVVIDTDDSRVMLVWRASYKVSRRFPDDYLAVEVNGS